MHKTKAMKWVKALRSGKYKQGQGQLLTREAGKKTQTFCCLGVLANINGYHDDNLVNKEILDFSMRDKCGLLNPDGQAYDLDKDEGVRIKIKNVWETMQAESLAQANDVGVSFRRIATWIEKNYKLL